MNVNVQSVKNWLEYITPGPGGALQIWKYKNNSKYNPKSPQELRFHESTHLVMCKYKKFFPWHAYDTTIYGYI